MSESIYSFAKRHRILLVEEDNHLVHDLFLDNDVHIYCVNNKMYAFDVNSDMAVVTEFFNDSNDFNVYYYYGTSIVCSYSDILPSSKIILENNQIKPHKFELLTNITKYRFFNNYYKHVEFELAQQITASLNYNDKFSINTCITQQDDDGGISYIDICSHIDNVTTTIFVKKSRLFKITNHFSELDNKLLEFSKNYFDVGTFAHYDEINGDDNYIRVSGHSYICELYYNGTEKSYGGTLIELTCDENNKIMQSSKDVLIPDINEGVSEILNYFINHIFIKHPKYTLISFLSEQGIEVNENEIKKEHIELVRMISI